MDPETRRALSSFYREEFERHLDQLVQSGLAPDRASLDRVCRFMAGLDDVCCRSDFSRLAEAMLQNFDCLTRLSELDPRQGH